MRGKLIIFDFDGTLADTLDAIVGITNRLALEFGYKPTSPEELDQVRNLSSREIFKQSGISLFKLPFLLKRVKANLHQEIPSLKPLSGIQEALFQLKCEGHKLGILTSNSEENVTLFLREHGMQDLFSFVYSATTIFGKHRLIEKIMKTNNLNSEEVVYVGDETRDIESSQKVKIRVIAVSWGFNSKSALAEHNPDFLIDRPGELIEVMEKIQEKILS